MAKSTPQISREIALGIAVGLAFGMTVAGFGGSVGVVFGVLGMFSWLWVALKTHNTVPSSAESIVNSTPTTLNKTIARAVDTLNGR